MNLTAGISTTVDVTLNSDGALTMADGALVDAGNSTIVLSSGGDMTLGGLKTTNNTATAVVLNSSGGSIIDGGDTHLEVDAANGNLKMTAAGGIGDGNPLEIKVASLVVSSSGAGGISLNEADSVTLTSIRNSDGSISVTTGGTMTVSNTTVTTTGGKDSDDIILTTTAGDIELGTVTASGAGDVTLIAAGTINGGIFTGDEAFIQATTIGLTTPPIANVSDFIIRLSQKNEINLSGDLVEGANLNNFPPQAAVSAPGVVRLLPSGFTYGIGFIGAPILVPTATGQQIRFEQELRRATQAAFFREEPVIIEMAFADLSEELEEELEELEEEEGPIEEELVPIETED
jgi:hypothetical protein